MPLLPHKQMYTQTHTHALRNIWWKVHCNQKLIAEHSVCFCDCCCLCICSGISIHLIGGKGKAIYHALTSSITRTDIICHVSGRMKGSLSRDPHGGIISENALQISQTHSMHQPQLDSVCVKMDNVGKLLRNKGLLESQNRKWHCYMMRA